MTIVKKPDNGLAAVIASVPKKQVPEFNQPPAEEQSEMAMFSNDEYKFQ